MLLCKKTKGNPETDDVGGIEAPTSILYSRQQHFVTASEFWSVRRFSFSDLGEMACVGNLQYLSDNWDFLPILLL